MRLASSLALLPLACGGPVEAPLVEGAPADDTDLTVSLAAPEAGYQIVTAPFEVPANSEVDMCSVVRLEPEGDETIAWVDHMESMSAAGTHHMNVVIGQFSFLDAFVGEGASEEALGVPLGTWPCSELPVMERGFPIFPSQRDNQHITMPPGVAAPLPLPLVAVFSHHYVNAGDEALTINAALNLNTVAAEEVEHVAGMLFDDIGDLEVPPLSRRTEARTCVVDREVELALVSTHTHEWATCATMNRVDGASGDIEAAPFFVNKLWDTPPILHFEPGSFALSPGDGVHWACHYRNPSDLPLVNDGTAEGEMCVMAAVTWPAAFEVAEVEEIVASQDLASLLSLMDEVLGPCDEERAEEAGPWSAEAVDLSAPDACEGLAQTESNTLY